MVNSNHDYGPVLLVNLVDDPMRMVPNGAKRSFEEFRLWNQGMSRRQIPQ